MGANLDVMRADTTRMRTNAQGVLKPFVRTNLKTLAGVADVVSFIETRGMLKSKLPSGNLAIPGGLEIEHVLGTAALEMKNSGHLVFL